MAVPIDARALYDAGTLRAVTLGLSRRYRREGHLHDLVAEVASPILRLSDDLRRQGQAAQADDVLAHAVHDGITPSMLQEGQVANSAADHADQTTPVSVGVNPALSGAVNLDQGAWVKGRDLSGMRDVPLIRSGPNGVELGSPIAGAPAAATDAASTQALANFLRQALIDLGAIKT